MRRESDFLGRTSGEVVDAALKAHSALGPGLLESAYEACLAHELRVRGLEVLVQVAVPVVYEGYKVEVGYRIDLLVENSVIVESKQSASCSPLLRVLRGSNRKKHLSPVTRSAELG